MPKILTFCVLASFVFCACATTSSNNTKQKENLQRILTTNEEETRADAVSAMESVTEALTGRELTNEEVKNIEGQLKNDPEARSAMDAITNSVEGKKPAVKYSPATGKRYSADMEYCPETGVRLLPVK